MKTTTNATMMTISFWVSDFVDMKLFKNMGRKCFVFVALCSFLRCAPFSSEMQSARLVGKRNVEITPGYSSVQFEQKAEIGEKVEKASIGRLVGLQAAYGLSEKVDIRVRFEHFQFRNLFSNIFSIGPKFNLVKDRVALYLPLWFVNYKPALVLPTFLFTLPVYRNKIEFNPSVKNILSVGGYDPNSTFLFAFSAGLGISTDLSRWAIRPEYGIVYNVKEKCQYGNFSIGVSFNMSRLFRK